MKVVCVGGGPAGLDCSILLKEADPRHDITMLERNHPDDTFGWGVVFSDATLDNFRQADPASHAEIVRSFHHWDDIDVFFKGTRITSSGHGFCGIGRKKLLNILQARAGALGVKQVFQTEVADEAPYADADLVIAADGVNSTVRRTYAEHFKPDIDVRKCRYIWLGSHQPLQAFTFAFEQTAWGWFQLHAYRFDRDTSTFIVETREESWLAAGLDRADPDASVAFCEGLFGAYLGGHRLLTNSRHLRGSAWLNFNRVLCEKWHHRNIVLIGDAAHTAHFSIGSGTKLAMEDAISLSRALTEQPAIEAALQRYARERSTEALRLQSAARNRMEWFENVERYTHLDPLQFSYALLTGSQRIGHDNLRLRDRGYVDRVETWLAEHSGLPAKPVPPMFTPFRLRAVTPANRVVVSPMAMYSCRDGLPDDFYLVHLGSRALGGAGLVFTEMTCVAADARISPGCAGLWNDEQAHAWKRVVDFVHTRSGAKIGLQLGHAGPKGSTQLGWEEIDEPLAQGNWPLIAPSPVAYGPTNQVPRAMTRADMDRVRGEFVRAAQWGAACGFDILELHCAHGYLLSSFICPLTNQRTDEYGGALADRLRFPLEVFRGVRRVWPAEGPMSLGISAHVWARGGNRPEDAGEIGRRCRVVGADLVDGSSGQTTRQARPVYGRMYQAPFSDRIRNEVGIATMAVGNIFEADHVNSIIAAGRADLCALARPHLADPFWTLHAAAQLGYSALPWPPQYLNGKEQLERNLARTAQMAMNV